jgi:hypothetical protein
VPSLRSEPHHSNPGRTVLSIEICCGSGLTRELSPILVQFRRSTGSTLRLDSFLYLRVSA